MLSRAEESVDPKSKKLAYESLLMLYGNAGKAEDVYRIWDMYKNLPDKNSEGYRLVISFSLKLGDIVTADKIRKEWVKGYNKFDVRIVSMMASAYCERGLTTNAKGLMRSMMIQKYISDMPIRHFLLLLLVCYHLSCDLYILLDFVSKMVLAIVTKEDYEELEQLIDF
ncbi:Pentatricopeptide repeat-containing protein [Cardamine amara subsp. amara]